MRRRIRINIGFSALISLLILAIYSPRVFIPLIFAVFLHELGHVIAAKLCGIRICELGLSFLGASLYPERPLYSYFKEAVLCVGGPLFNIVTAIAARLVLGGDRCETFIGVSVGLALLNLLPISGFDGGNILRSALNSILSPSSADRLCKYISFTLALVLWSASVYLLLRHGASLSAFVFFCSLFSRLFLFEDGSKPR